MTDKNSDFIIRVYGIYVEPKKGLLVSDEFIKGRQITKLPGGGLEYGEGLRDCLRREMLEETQTRFRITDHFYTTDFFVESAFHKDKQVISVYYRMEPEEPLRITVNDSMQQLSGEGAESFRYIPMSEVSPESFSLIIDSHVAKLLREEWRKHRHG